MLRFLVLSGQTCFAGSTETAASHSDDAPVAQRIRAMGFYPTGRGFDSLPGYQFKSPPLRWVFELVPRDSRPTAWPAGNRTGARPVHRYSMHAAPGSRANCKAIRLVSRYSLPGYQIQSRSLRPVLYLVS